MAITLSWDEAEPNGMQEGIERAGLDGVGDVGNVFGSAPVVVGGSEALLTVGLVSGHERTRTLGTDL